jgi:hypothetical protein
MEQHGITNDIITKHANPKKKAKKHTWIRIK